MTLRKYEPMAHYDGAKQDPHDEPEMERQKPTHQSRIKSWLTPKRSRANGMQAQQPQQPINTMPSPNGVNKALEIGWSVLKDEKPYPDDDMWSIVDQNLQIGGLDDYNRQQEPYYRQQIADQQIEELMTQMPRPHSNRVDCANCNNYPMSKVARPATGGVEPYYMCPRCGNSVRVM